MSTKKSDSGLEESGWYHAFLANIKTRIRTAQYEALRAANKELVSLYWDLGRLIVERQDKEGWGAAVIEKLAKDLQLEFPGKQGFSARNLWNMRSFYVSYKDSTKLQPLVAEISWSHNVVIMDRCKDELEREFYVRMAKLHGWSKNVLIHQIDSRAYERTLSSQTNFNETLPAELRDRAKLTVKDEYTFDFLSLADDHQERELEAAILARVEPFLREMGGVFTFVGSQYRLEVGDHEYFVDILLYHRKLKCLVAVELKVGEFVPEYLGKMQFYLAALDDLVKEDEENPSIGIIICRSKDRLVVEYTLRDTRRPIGVSTYRVLTDVPADLKGLLPAPEQIARLLNEVEPE